MHFTHCCFSVARSTASLAGSYTHLDVYKRQEEPDPQTVSEFEERYKTILSIAGDEYDYEPPGKYYRDGYNPVSYTHLEKFD